LQNFNCKNKQQGGKLFLGTPLRRTDVVPEERIVATQLIHLGGKYSFSSISRMTECSIVSNAFAKSNLTITISLLDC
jgi:hypothetical protein